MTRRVEIKILAALFIFLFSVCTYLYAEEVAGVLHTPGERYAREEARQHYQQGKEFYAEGRYEEARNEFEKAIDSISPPTVGATEKLPAQQKALEITPAPVTTPKTKLADKKKLEEKEAKETQATEATAGLPSAPETEQAEEREYYIDTGDILDVSVWQIPELSRSEVIVRPDGKISFPLIGDIRIEGLTLTQLDDIITEKLKVYVKNPEVSIMIRRFGEQANKVVILGEVLAPGVYRFSGPPTITEVVASAGGYTKYAVLNSIMVVRGALGDKPGITRVNLAQIIKRGKISENIMLKPNDIVYVPRSFIGKVNVFLELIQPAISEYMQTMDARRFHNVMHRN